MATLTVDNGEGVPPMRRGLSATREITLRVIGAALQIVATMTVVQVLPSTVAGIYFKGAVVAYGLAALLRGKYELFIYQRFIGRQQADWDISARDLVRGLGIRVLVRSAIACAVLLVVTADLDVMDVYMRPYLQTYLPFVLAVPFATLALFLAATLRAANRTLGSIMVSSYSINLLIIAAALLADVSPEPALLMISWGFFVGSVLAAGIGVLLTRYVFQISPTLSKPRLHSSEWREIYSVAGRNGITGMALAGLQWGPACVIALFGTAVDIAHFAVAMRTAQIIDFLIPAVVFVPQSASIHSRLCDATQSARRKLTINLSVSVATTSACALGVALATPWFIHLYGSEYEGLSVLFGLVIAMQWVQGAARPALRQLAADWKLSRIRRVLFTSMAAAVLVSLAGVQEYGPLAVAAGLLLGALLEHLQALASVYRHAGEVGSA
jgi:hypothetical protein